MRKYLLLVLCTMYLVLFVSARQVNAVWDCNPAAIAGVPLPLPAIPPQPRCVEQPPTGGRTIFNSLRECLRGKNNAIPLVEETDPAINKCVDDPRWVMRNFAALNFWSIGKGLSLAVPLVIVGGGLLCLVFMLFGAYTYIMSGGEEKKLTDAMHMMTYAGLGLLVIVIGYAVVRTVLFITKINTFGF